MTTPFVLTVEDFQTKDCFDLAKMIAAELPPELAREYLATNNTLEHKYILLDGLLHHSEEDAGEYLFETASPEITGYYLRFIEAVETFVHNNTRRRAPLPVVAAMRPLRTGTQGFGHSSSVAEVVVDMFLTALVNIFDAEGLVPDPSNNAA